MTSFAEDWGGISRFAPINGPVHFADFGGPVDGPRLVFVHGLGGSHLNWCLLAPKLLDTARMVAVDLIGFGLTEPKGRSASVSANAAILHEFIHYTVGRPVILVGNSMGGLISLLEALRHPVTVAGLVLLDPALPFVPSLPDPRALATIVGRALPRFGRRVPRQPAHTARQLVQHVLRFCCADPSSIPTDVVAAHVALAQWHAEVPGVHEAFSQAVRSMVTMNVQVITAWTALRTLLVPVLLLHGEQDRVVPARASRVAAAVNPRWTVEFLPGVGHMPQLEVPDLVAGRILDWLAGPGAAAAHAATTPSTPPGF